MLNSIRIKNFRLFESLEVKRLGRVTLLVGKNNSGKSSFLEALLLYLNMPFNLILFDLIGFRQNHRNPDTLAQPFRLSESPVRHIFLNHIIPQTDKDSLRIKVDTSKGENALKICCEEMKPDTLDGAYLIVEIDGTKQTIWSKDTEESYREQMKPSSSYGMMSVGGLYSKKDKHQYIPTFGIPDWSAAIMWDKITITDLELDIVESLKIIEPRIVKIAFIGNQFGLTSERLPIAKLSAMEETVTLRSLGDGVTRLFHILLAIANAKDGTLLIDEFENGFHWSVQEKVWTAVFELAEKLNVQVFATTHSRDCVQAFSKVWTENEEAGAFIRLENNEGVVRAQEYNSRSLARSIRAEVEVR